MLWITGGITIAGTCGERGLKLLIGAETSAACTWCLSEYRKVKNLCGEMSFKSERNLPQTSKISAKVIEIVEYRKHMVWKSISILHRDSWSAWKFFFL